MSKECRLTSNERIILRSLGGRGGGLSAIRLRAATQLSVSDFVSTIRKASDQGLIQIVGNRVSLTARGVAALTVPAKVLTTKSVSVKGKPTYLESIRTACLPVDALYTPNMEFALQGLMKLARI